MNFQTDLTCFRCFTCLLRLHLLARQTRAEWSERVGGGGGGALGPRRRRTHSGPSAPRNNSDRVHPNRPVLWVMTVHILHWVLFKLAQFIQAKGLLRTHQRSQQSSHSQCAFRCLCEEYMCEECSQVTRNACLRGYFFCCCSWLLLLLYWVLVNFEVTRHDSKSEFCLHESLLMKVTTIYKDLMCTPYVRRRRFVWWGINKDCDLFPATECLLCVCEWGRWGQ